ncbi:hypothetical protein FHS29_004934 [Saccharothrix tamanrassetensis]|uniref:Secreted protein n=1 Tax=Saccharothrix tamanrassetensis TaxID=1051531 RepID=A0A841CS96_9PSEU|nr:hypothetical protein [Saccharothrix tamanrassetensis]MBB5958326.1 hypothetical protein [Saccharothrix tamanrassetensis]
MWRPSAALGALLLATACGADAGEKMCTLMGAPAGIELRVEPTAVDTGTIEVCWGGRCVSPEFTLWPSSRAADATCTGTAPDDVCGARAVPTGAKHANVDIADLPAEPVTVKLSLADRTGTAVVERELTATPEVVHPNGPDCDAGGPQLILSVAPDGSVTAG